MDFAYNGLKQNKKVTILRQQYLRVSNDGNDDRVRRFSTSNTILKMDLKKGGKADIFTTITIEVDLTDLRM